MRLPSSLPLSLAFTALASAGCSAHADQIRADAASYFDCDSSRVDVDKIGHDRYLATGCGRSQEYSCAPTGRVSYRQGRYTYCTADVDPAPIVVATPPAPRPLLEAPTGAGGFSFGDTEEKVRAACEKAAHVYASDGHGGGSCDGLPADVGSPARATLKYCDGTVCAVSLRVQPATGENIGHALTRWKGALLDKYGGPSSSDIDVSHACESDVIPCLRNGKSKVEFDWEWTSRTRIALAPKAEGEAGAAVEIAYVARAREGATQDPLAGDTMNSPVRALLEPPAGAGGFQFGDTEAQVREACTKAGHSYRSEGAKVGGCDGLAASVGSPARARLTYCAGAICEVTLQVEPAPGDEIGEALARWKGALVQKYGGPSASQVDVRPACRTDLIPCLRDGTSKVRFDWQWGDYRRISIVPRPAAEGDRALVEITYAAWGTAAGAPGL